jgi:membrane AbrB-like protein
MDAPVRALAGLLVAAAAGAACAWLGMPIPWMLGPLFALAFLRVAGVDVRAPAGARPAGQWIIGTALGLYFTPATLASIASVWYLPLAGAAFAIAIGYAGGALLARLAGLDLTTGVFASVPGGAADMATLGERYGARVDRVAAAHSVRLLLVVAIVPASFTLAGVHGSDAFLPARATFDAEGFAVLMSATFAGALVAKRFDVPNAFILGSLAVATALTAAGSQLSAVPTPVSNAGQLLLGCALGSRFEPDFLRGAPRFLGAVAITVLLSIVASTLFGVALAKLAGQPVAPVVLGMAPGGIAEMTVTAKVLQIGVPLVTAFHVARVVTLLLLTGPLFRAVGGRLGGRGPIRPRAPS